MEHPNNYAVIMAGGIGSRFWPMSRTAYPKQFHDVLGTGKTLIQQTWDRLRLICPAENILVVTNEQYNDLVKEQLPDILPHNVVGEPNRRNTAPCIAYASHKIYAQNPDASIIVAPSDHLILKETAFVNTVKLAIEKANQEDCLVTLGIKPSRPDTGYGYIQFIDDENSENSKVCKVKTFTEKPDHELAEQFIESGDFYWNSGIFIWTAKSILNAFELHLSEMHALFLEGKDAFNTDAELEFIKKAYPVCQNISIDYGVMENAENVYVVLSDFGWSDLGTWGSLYTHIKKDENENAVIGKRVKLYDASKNIVKVPDDKLVVLQGLDDYIVVDADNILLVCKKQDEQKIKQFVTDVRLDVGQDYV